MSIISCSAAERSWVMLGGWITQLYSTALLRRRALIPPTPIALLHSSCKLKVVYFISFYCWWSVGYSVVCQLCQLIMFTLTTVQLPFDMLILGSEHERRNCPSPWANLFMARFPL